MTKSLNNPCHCITARRAASALTACYDRALAECGLSITQFSLLWNLDALAESNVTRLAECVGLERSTLVRNLKPLIANGYIRDGADDGSRDRKLFVTAEGKAALTRGIPLWKRMQKEIYSKVGAGDIEIFRKVAAAFQQM